MSRGPGPPPLPQGACIAPGYEVVGHLRRGRWLDVYDAWSDARSCRCVVKAPRPDQLDDEATTGRLLREGRLLARLSHPHIVRCYEVIRVPRPIVVLETLTGEALDHVLEERRPRLTITEAAWLGLHLSSALDYLHSYGWLHLDLKPSNVVCGGGRATLIDLSIARRPGRPRHREGTLDYMAPEQVTGALLTQATDLWGLGALLFEALAGQTPFEGRWPEGLRSGGGFEPDDSELDASAGSSSGRDDPDEDYPQVAGRAPSIGRLRRLPASLRGAVDACLEPDPSGRPTLAELEDALVQAAGAHPKRATDPPA